jgi:hypothetical protein
MTTNHKKPLYPKLRDAQHARQYPDAFMARLRSLRPYDTVKVSNAKDRFWVLLTGVQGDDLWGTVANNLIGECGYNYGDVIHFRRENVCDIAPKRPS